MMFGDYSRYNLQNEPNWAKPILEANAGLKFQKQKYLDRCRRSPFSHWF